MRKKLFILVSIILIALLSGVGIWNLIAYLQSLNAVTDYSVVALQWTVIGAVGSWVGSIFAAVALTHWGLTP